MSKRKRRLTTGKRYIDEARLILEAVMPSYFPDNVRPLIERTLDLLDEASDRMQQHLAPKDEVEP